MFCHQNRVICHASVFLLVEIVHLMIPRNATGKTGKSNYTDSCALLVRLARDLRPKGAVQGQSSCS
jgi:hypothetical protein